MKRVRMAAAVVLLAAGVAADGTLDEGKREADGAVAEGSVVEGKREGHWVVRSPDGEVQEGIYVKGKREGRWVKRSPDGRVDEGPYVDVMIRRGAAVPEGRRIAGIAESGRRPERNRKPFPVRAAAWCPVGRRSGGWPSRGRAGGLVP